MLLMVSTFVACGDDETPEPTPETITEIAAANSSLSTLVAALQRTGLDETLNASGNFTVFAPTNAAFTAANIDLSALSDDKLKDILLYHVIGAEIKAGDIADGQTYAASLSTGGPLMSSLSLLIEKGTNVKINNVATVSTADVDATNGVIHIVDAVLTRLDVVGHAVANSNFTSLVSALGDADGDLVNVLQGDGPFTVFAPLNTAFADITDITDDLTTAQLADVLTYHVVGGNNTAGILEDGDYATVNGASFSVSTGTEVIITDEGDGESKVVLTDVQATNGVIHVLNRVLIPTL